MKKPVFIIISLLSAAIIITLIINPFQTHQYPKPKNIIFLLFDAMRPDHLGAYGWQRNTSPAMDAIARDGIVFERAFSQASWTLPSVASFFTSTYTDFHGTENMTSKLPKSLVTMAEYMNKSGYRTIGASNNYLVSRYTKMARGFWDWADEMRDPALTNYLISYLDPENINYFRLANHNYFENYSFQKLTPQLLKTGERYPYGCYDRNAYSISSESVSRNGLIVLSKTLKPVKPGTYDWGAAFRKLSGNGSIKISIAEETGNGLKELTAEKIDPSGEWRNFTFSFKTDRTIEILAITVSFIDDTAGKGDYKIAADDLFIMPVKKRSAKSRCFFYLHYINTHEPHHEPKEIRGTYSNLFTDFKQPAKLISESEGDIFDLNNAKYILHRSRIETWIKENDEINLQLNMYDREIKYMDDQVERIVRYLKQIGEYDDTMFIITADHGDEFLEHGHISHGLSLYNEVIHIPLIISYPKAFSKGVRVQQNVAAIDVFATFVDLLRENTPFDAAIKSQLTGKSLLPLIEGDDENRNRVIFSSDYFTSQTAAIFGEWKSIRRQSVCGDAKVLFNLNTDFSETRNYAYSERQMSKNLDMSIESYKKAANVFRKKLYQTENPGKFTEKEMKIMRKGLLELGYINASDDVFKISKNFEDAFCHVVRFRLQMKLYLTIIGLL